MSRYQEEDDYSAAVLATFGRFKQGAVKDYRIRYRMWPGMNHVAAQILDMVARLFPEEFAALDQYCRQHAAFLDEGIRRAHQELQFYLAQSADHIGSYFTMLRAELAFYVGCLNLAGRLAAKRVPVAVPDPAPPSPPVFSCADLRDACLELQSQGPVVGNDVQADGKSLVIITGANSGGKSTFLRSVGVAQLMMQCGLFVTAGSYRADVASGIFTHFVREEDSDLTSGRLDDELRRMSAIADHIRPHYLMLFNESFAGTNEREGSEIGYQVVRALLDADIKVFFVTHRSDFAERFRRQQAGATLFLRAERRPDGSRNYKLAAKDPLPTSFGEDLYYRLGGWLDEDKTLPHGTKPGSLAPAARARAG